MTTKTISTTDAMVWAQEFCLTFDGCIVRRDTSADHDHEINDGTMLTWFANAIEIGRAAGRKETCPHAPEDQFTIADDLSSCRKCGEIFVEPS
jgi:hypothetical protein